MATFIYRCLNTGLNVQGWSAEDVSDEPESYEATTCTAHRGGGKFLRRYPTDPSATSEIRDPPSQRDDRC
jgi:hypothetical protein